MSHTHLPAMDLRDPQRVLRDLLAQRRITLNGRNGMTGGGVEDHVRSAVAAAADALTPEGRAALAQLEAEARAERLSGVFGNAARRLQGVRVTTVNNYLLASTMIAAGFFEVINLKEDEYPVYLGEVGQEVSFRHVAQNGGVQTTTLNSDDVSGDPVKINGVARTSGWVRYPVMDIHRGTLLDSATKTIDIARDLAWNKDMALWDLLKAGLGAFSGKNTGKRANRAFNLHSAINPARLPSTTAIDVSGNSGPRIKVLLDAILKYETSWGAGTFRDGDLRATGEIFLSSDEVSALFAELSITSNLSDVGNEIQKAGPAGVRYANRTWSFVPLATTQMTAKKAYPRFNKPAGYVYLKESSPLNGEEVRRVGDFNQYEERRHTAWWAAYCPAPMSMNFVEITYLP